MRRFLFLSALIPALAVSAGAGSALQLAGRAQEGMVRIEGGAYRPLYRQPGEDIVAVKSFLLDTRPVSRADFEAFVAADARWQRGAVPSLFADAGYLQDWASPAAAGTGALQDAPVTRVSWFAARAYCAARGARLPTTHEWEYVALADETRRDASGSAAFRQRALELSLRRNADGSPTGFRNAWGVDGMHGGVVEWVSDFQSIFAGSDSRVSERHERQLTCAGGATVTGDARDYAAFLRYAWRASVEARTTTATLGFRCARDA